MAKKKPAEAEKASSRTVATNRRARFDYEILETFEAGVSLVGSEVKSLRSGKADLKDSYAAVEKREMWLHGVRISPYEFARDGGHDPERSRKLLLHRAEIDRIGAKLAEKGLTLVPMRMYFKEGKVKVELGLARGKAQRDKRETIKQREANREMERVVRHRSVD
jgi:SsrA-binding protein